MMFPEMHETPALRPTDVNLRAYQREAIDAVRGEFSAKKKATLLVMATGLGKTVVMGSIARMVAERGGRTLILAHRGELIDQATETIMRLGMTPGVEKADQRARSLFEPHVVVATVQTMQRKRLEGWPRDYFKLVMTDEAHHATADTYRNIYNHFDALKLGVTATADRADEEFLGDVFESVAYEYSLWDAMTAPEPGPYLSRLRFVQCDVGIDLRSIRTTAGDLNAADLEEAIRPHIETLANAIKQEVGDRKTLIFTPDVGSATAMATALDSIGLRTRWVAGDSPDRKAIIAGFRNGDFQALANCLDDQTEILTSRGWVGQAGIRETDITATFNLRTGAIEWEPIKAIVRRERGPDERMVSIQNQTLDIRVTEGHRMVVRTKGAKNWTIAEAGTFPGRVASYQIPMAGDEEPDWDVFFPDGTIPPWKLSLDQCKFIGLWVADGTLDRHGYRGVSISQSGVYPESNAEIRRLLDSCGFDWKCKEYAAQYASGRGSVHPQYRYRIPKGNIKGSLERRGYVAIEAYLDKDLSPLINGFTKEQFKAFVEGLWLGDGVKFKGRPPRNGRRSGWNIVNTNKTMLERLQILAVTRGFACNLSRPRSNGPLGTKPIQVIRIRERPAVTTNNTSVPTSGGNPARFEEGWKPETVWCVTNETGTIITRRNGKVAVTGQCNLATEGFDVPDIEAVVLCRPTKSRPLYAQMCLDDQTEILTRRGWVTPDTISDDDEAAAFDLADGSIQWSPILSRVDRRLQPEESMFGIASPSLDIRLTDQHRMVYRSITGRAKARSDWGFVEASQLAEIKGQFEIPVSGVEPAPGLDLTDSQIRFIGWFLTDGGINKVTNSITIYQDHKSPFLRDIELCLQGCGFKYAVYTETRRTEFSEESTILKFTISKGIPRGTDKHLKGWAELEPYIDKSFSPLLDGLSRVQLGILIDEMNKGDGLKRNSVDWRVQTTSICTGIRTLADRMQSLCVRRGFRCNVAEGDWNASPIYILHIKDESVRYVGGCNWSDRPTFSPRLLIPFERVWCIEVETGAIVTRRNGKVAIVGNCGRGTRLSPGKEYCLLVDFNWLTSKHDLVKPVELFDTTKTDGETLDIATELLESRKGLDLKEAVEQAREEQKRRTVLRIKAREREVRYRRVAYDPLSAMATLGVAARKEASGLQGTITEKQRTTLERFGLTGLDSCSKRRAHMLLDTIFARKNQGLATVKQVGTLIGFGFDPAQARAMSKDQASQAIGEKLGKQRVG